MTSMKNKRINTSKMIKTVRPINVAPGIKAARWTFLLFGILYGASRLRSCREFEKRAHPIRQKKIKEKYEKLAIQAKLQVTEELVSLAKEFEVTELPPDWNKDL